MAPGRRPARKRARSTGKKLDDRWKEAEALRKKYALRPLDGPEALTEEDRADMNLRFPQSAMSDINRLCNALREIRDGLGRVPAGPDYSGGLNGE